MDVIGHDGAGIACVTTLTDGSAKAGPDQINFFVIEGQALVFE